MPHTHAASPIPPVTPETQAPPQTLGRESRRKSWWWDAPPRPTLLDSAETIITILNSLCLLYPWKYQEKKDEIFDSLCVTHPLIKPGTRKMRLQLTLKLLFTPCFYQPQQSKCCKLQKKIGLLSFSSMIINDHCSPHTLIHTILSAQIGLGGTGTGSFSVPLFPIKSPQTRFLNHCK